MKTEYWARERTKFSPECQRNSPDHVSISRGISERRQYIITGPRVYVPLLPHPSIPRRHPPTGEHATRRRRLPPSSPLFWICFACRRWPFPRRGIEPPLLCSWRIWCVCCDVLQVRRRRRGCRTASSSTRGTVPSASSPGSAPPATGARVRTHLSLPSPILVSSRFLDSFSSNSG